MKKILIAEQGEAVGLYLEKSRVHKWGEVLTSGQVTVSSPLQRNTRGINDIIDSFARG